MELGPWGQFIVFIILWLAYIGVLSIFRAIKNGINIVLNKEI